MIRENFTRGDRPPGAGWYNDVARAANLTNGLKGSVHNSGTHSNNGLTGQVVIKAMIPRTMMPPDSLMPLPRLSVVEIKREMLYSVDLPGEPNREYLLYLNNQSRYENLDECLSGDIVYLVDKPHPKLGENRTVAITLKEPRVAAMSDLHWGGHPDGMVSYPMGIELVDAVIMGIVPCLVNVTNKWHRYARTIEEDTTMLVSAPSGNIRIVCEPVEEGIQMVDVMLGFAGDQLFPMEIVQSYENSPRRACVLCRNGYGENDYQREKDHNNEEVWHTLYDPLSILDKAKYGDRVFAVFRDVWEAVVLAPRK